jgi:electron transport complex protein RnfC
MNARIPATTVPVGQYQNPRPIHDFRGGIHPPQNKDQSTGRPIRRAPLPEQLVLPLNMHLGAPAKALVSAGDRVLKGQKIAEGNGAVSLPIHAPTSGTVMAVGERPIQHPSGLHAPCIVIAPDGEETWTELHPLTHWRECAPSMLVARIREAGIAGMGGAGFPAAVKLNLRDGQQIEELVINAVECEPYITADDMLMRERAEQIIAGIEKLQFLLQPKATLVGIEDNKPEAIKAMRAAAEGKAMDILVVPTKYPSGGEKQLIELLTGKEVPSGGIPAQVGVVCHNIGTAVAIHRAIEFGEPLISRITTLTGDAFTEPGNVEVLLGTPVQSLLDYAGATAERVGRLIMGGPMMGFAIHTPSVPVVKTTNCIIAATAEELPAPPPEQPCIRCGSCAEVCPANLLPQQLYWYSKTEDLERAQQYNLMDCIECGACAYVCPSNIPLVQYYRHAKGEVRHQVAEQQKADKARERFEARKARLEKEAAEKEARRKARLEASKQKTSAAPDVDLAALKKASLEASSAYKAAVKALKAAETDGADPDTVASLRTEADNLKARADGAKAAVREAKAGGTATVDTGTDKVAELKKAVGEASSAYKAAVKDAKAAEEAGADNAADLRSHADELKGKADALKAQLRDAKAAAPATSAPAAKAEKSAEQASSEAADRAQKMKALKTAFNMANKQWKEASAALERAERDGADEIDVLRKKVDKLRFKADKAKEALNVLVEEAKRNIEAASGSDLKTLKLEAGRTEAAVRAKERELEDAKRSGDQEQIDVIYRERDALRREAAMAANALQSAIDEQGLKED